MVVLCRLVVYALDYRKRDYMTEPYTVEAPDRFKYWCRTCTNVTVHNNKRRFIECVYCAHRVHSVEVVAAYSTNDYNNEELSLPKELRV